MANNELIEQIPLLSTFKDQLYIPVLIALFLVLFTTLLIYLYCRILQHRPDTILFVGLANSGKTTIFTKIINKANSWITYTSVKENQFSNYLRADGKAFKLVDYPGSEAFRKTLFQKWLALGRKNLKCVVFTIDSASFNKRDVAEFLYDVLYELKGKVPLLVVCNKQDIGHAKAGELIQKTIEQEFGLINISREAALSSTEGESTKRLLVETGRAFKWTDLKQLGNGHIVDFVECSAEKDSQEAEFSLDPLRKWINSI